MAVRSKYTKNSSVETVEASQTSKNATSASVSPDKHGKKTPQMKRKSYTYEDKLEIINLLNSQSKLSVCKNFSLSARTLNKWIKEASIIKEMCNDDHSKKLKKKRCSGFEDVDDDLYRWFLEQRAKGTPISGIILQGRALEISRELGIRNFKASDGWLSRWKSRKNVRLLSIIGEELSMDVSMANKCKNDFADIINKEKLSKGQSFNFDETGLYCKTLPTKTFVTSDEIQPLGYEKDQNHLTIGDSSNADVSLKIPLAVITKSNKPEALKNLSENDSLEFYPHEEDDCKSHLTLSVIDIKTEPLPPKVTSTIQPMDQEIFEKLKKRYGSQLVSSILQAQNNKGVAIKKKLKDVTINDVINWISDSWDEIHPNDDSNQKH